MLKIVWLNGTTLLRQMLRDSDDPSRRNSPPMLTPLETCRTSDTEFRRSIINDLPGERVSHSPQKWTNGPLSQAEFSKDNMSNDFLVGRRHKVSMISRTLLTPAEFEAMLIDRTKALREHRGMTSAEMATALDVPVDRYRKYESRTPLPHAMIERFAIIVGVSPEFVLTGRRIAGKGPYPDVPGPHMVERWRQGRAELSRKRGRPAKK